MSNKIEQGILACILKGGDSITEVVSNGINPTSFQDTQCSEFFESMLKVYSSGLNPDYVEMCMQEGADIAFLGHLDGLVDTPAMLGSYLAKQKASMGKIELLGKLKEIWELTKNNECDPQKAIGMMCELDKNTPNSTHLTVSDEVTKLIDLANNPENAELTKTFTFGMQHCDNKLTRMRKSELIVIGARPSTGKCLSPEDELLMADGSTRKHKDIKVGDLILDENGKPTKVIGISRGYDEMFQVDQMYGMSYSINSRHLLSLKCATTVDKIHREGDIYDYTVDEYEGLSNRIKRKLKGYRNSNMVYFNDNKSLPIDPYLLGVYLGDGARNKGVMTNSDEGIINELISNGFYEVKASTSRNFYKKGFLGELKKLKVDNEKFIPEQYLTAPLHKRLELLAGLIDTDGYNGETSWEIIQKSNRLAKDIKRLIVSLGCRYRTIKKEGRINGELKGIYNRMTIYPNQELIDKLPLRVSRKKVKRLGFNQKSNGTIKITPKGIGEYIGLTVDSNTNRYLLSDGTVVHNTSLACQLMDSNATEGSNVIFFSFETDSDELSEIVMLQRTKRNLDHVTKDSTRLWEMQNDDSLNNMHIVSKPCTVEEIVGKVKAYHGSGRCDMVIIDYLQLIVPSDLKQSREQQVAHISRQLRLLTIDLNVPVIALAQLNRGTEKEERPPRMSDLRESGAIEQDASRIIMIHRPKDRFDRTSQDPEKGYTDFIFDTALLQVKCKKGPKGVAVPTRFVGTEQKFYPSTVIRL